ncbi:transposable element Tcb2 transposase [Trichonephila clavipes]|nr:transposable element Tcb2 transposase [Trichonephila clavipes]
MSFTDVRTPSTDQSSRRPPHRKKCTHTANCFIGRHPGTGSTFTRGPCVFFNPTKVPGCTTFGIAASITCAALDAHPSTPPFGVVLRTRKLDCVQRNGTMSSLATNPDSISAVMTIVFVCGDPVVNASILPFLYSDTAGVMVWVVIAYNTRSPLVLICGTMTAQRYVDGILQPHVLPLMQRLPGAIFQKDKARNYTARARQDCLRTVTTLPWLSRFPDLSPIKHIWDHLGR